MRTARMIAPLSLVTALTLTGCGADRAGFGDDDGTADPTTAQDATEPTQDPSGDEDGTAAGADGTESVDASYDPDDVVVSYEVEDVIDGAGGSTVTIGVHSLEVQDDVMLLQLYYTPDAPSAPEDERWQLSSFADEPTSAVLIDRPNLTEYSVIGRAADRGWSSPTAGHWVTNGETALWWGYFAAPADDTETLLLQVNPAHPVLEIPVQR